MRGNLAPGGHDANMAFEVLFCFIEIHKKNQNKIETIDLPVKRQ